MKSEDAPSELTDRTFELLTEAGRGGAGDVWKARAANGALVALKLARNDAVRSAIAREARHASLALSPRLPELVDVGWLEVKENTARVVEPSRDIEGARTAFVALRWIEGRSLRG